MARVPNLTSDWVTRSWDHVDVAVVTVVGCHLRGVDGVVDAVEGEEGGEVGGVAADHQQHAQPPGGRHYPARDGPAHSYTSAANRLIGEVVQSRRRPLLRPSPG